MKSFCSYYNQDVCKSCDLIETDYIAQLKLKEKKLLDSLAFANLPELLPSVESPLEHFRNKAKLVVTGTSQEPVLGLWGEDDLDEGRELLECPLHVKPINECLPHIIEFIKTAKLDPYQISSKTGELKGLILFHSENTNETYLRFILRSKESITRIQKFHKTLLDKVPHIKCLSANIQPVPHAVLEGEEEIFITEQNFIHHRAGAVTLNLGPRAFVQTNQFVANKLYATAADWIKETHLKKFMELFCGQGAFSFYCAGIIESGLGIEINPEAVTVANQTAQKNNLNHLSFKSADAALIGNEMKNFGADILLVNPPRRGLAGAVNLIQENRPEVIIYSSCNYQTLAKDVEALKEYSIRKIQIFDMFPHTNHFETLMLLQRN